MIYRVTLAICRGLMEAEELVAPMAQASMAGGEAFCLGDVVGDGVEDVDKNKEHSDEESHPFWMN